MSTASGTDIDRPEDRLWEHAPLKHESCQLSAQEWCCSATMAAPWHLRNILSSGGSFFIAFLKSNLTIGVSINGRVDGLNQASQDGRTDGLTANMQGRMRNGIDTISLGGVTILCVLQVSFKIRAVEVHKPGL